MTFSNLICKPAILPSFEHKCPIWTTTKLKHVLLDHRECVLLDQNQHKSILYGLLCCTICFKALTGIVLQYYAKKSLKSAQIQRNLTSGYISIFNKYLKLSLIDYLIKFNSQVPCPTDNHKMSLN